ncbi:MAG: lipoate--protein ligase family protein [Nitrospirota bacterium]
MQQHDIWRLITHPKLSPAMNMAIDEAIALTFPKNKIPTLRLYRWASPALTLGAFQKMPIPDVEEGQLTLIRRITGGRALLHDNDLTYSIVAGTDDPRFSGGLKKTFFSVAAGLLAGLRQLGIHAESVTPSRKIIPSRESMPFCVQSFSMYEIAISGKKIIGSAQKRWPTHFLQHGSIPLTHSVFETRLYKEASVVLSDFLPNLLERSQIEKTIVAGFETAWGIKWIEESLTNEENEMAQRLSLEKYQTDVWSRV